MIYKNGQPLETFNGKFKWAEILKNIDDTDIFVATSPRDYNVLSVILRHNFYTFLSGRYDGKYVARIISPKLFKELKNYA